jgi:hypothetical protein
VRLLLGALILLTCFAAAALWQRSWTSASRSSREPFPTTPERRGPAPPGDGWSRVVLGRPSGGEPYSGGDEHASGGGELNSRGGEPVSGSSEAAPQVPPSPEPQQPSPPSLPKPPANDPGVPEVDAVVIVQPGQTLSGICRERYGTAGHDLVLALARYNDLAGPDEIREGQRILLPSQDKLVEIR